MRSESEVQWVRVKNNVGQATRASDWHAIIPGHGSLDVPPGTACGVGLSGSRQMVPNSGIGQIDGRKHDECRELVAAFLATIDPSPGPRTPDDPDKEFAAPGSTKS